MKNTHIKLYPILLPFALLYGAVIRIRNLLFDRNLLPSQQHEIPVICIGNLAVGGTGKTPLVELLIQILSDKYRVAVLSRGYKRKSSGYMLANEQNTSSEIGDEACQIKQKYPHLHIAVDENRRRGMNRLLAMPKEVRPQVVLLDDGYQHRYVNPSLSILITDYNRLFCYDRLLPAGRLREPAKSVARANVILVSKCPDDLSRIDGRIIEKEINPASYQSLFFTGISYQQLKGVFPNECVPCKIDLLQKEDELLLVTGIANPSLLVKEIKKYSDKVSVLSFKDHHEFSKRDVARMQNVLSKMSSKRPLIICTEKDAVRIRNNPHFPDEWKSYLYYLPIQVHLLFEQREQFEKLIFRHITLIRG